MSAGRTPLDEVVTGGDEDVVLDKLSPNHGKTDELAEENAHGGGNTKAPDRIKPFTIREG